ncbi:MAG: 1-(5-phosphoribosyl)-5-[(5-phosphoribosylamino)methylideneamino]imidazole-4-carboxamide isomerase [Acidimicrobiales bacterium]
MDLYPAIDLRGGRCVRLLRGDYEAETAYSDDPVAQALAFAAAGARWIHVVDLDAARTGEAHDRATVEAIVAAVDVPVQVGGGVRSADAARALADIGVARVVVGTAAVRDPDLVSAIAGVQPVAVGLDARGRDVAVSGWTESTGLDLVELAGRFARAGADALVVTEIGRDGTMSGPDVDQLAAVLAVAGDTALIASGGVGRPEDLDALAALRVDGSRLAGVIVGRAIYEGAVDVADAVTRLAGHPR